MSETLRPTFLSPKTHPESVHVDESTRKVREQGAHASSQQKTVRMECELGAKSDG